MKRIVTIIFIMFSISLHAQEEEPLDEFDSWDGNRDGVITDEEFTTVWTDQDYFSAWDGDDDGVISKTEWNEGINTYYRNTENWQMNAGRDFRYWDRDTDGMLSEDEFREGTFNTWDDDATRTISETEYYNYSNTLGYSY